MNSEFSQKQEEEIIMRCIEMIDRVAELTLKAIYYCLHISSCPSGRNFLIDNPEEYTVRTIENIVRSYYVGERSPEGPAH